MFESGQYVRRLIVNVLKNCTIACSDNFQIWNIVPLLGNVMSWLYLSANLNLAAPLEIYRR